jgi:hypothetical protein
MAEAPQQAAPQGAASPGADDAIQASMPAAAGVDDALQACSREHAVGRLQNPFEAQRAGSAGKKGQPALKSEIFEVLREHPSGLEVADIVRLIKERKLRTFVGKAVSQVHPLSTALSALALLDAVEAACPARPGSLHQPGAGHALPQVAAALAKDPEHFLPDASASTWALT